MILKFPDHFCFGTSTSAAQIETPFQHDWLNVVARDGSIFNRTTDHEKRINEDVDIIASIAPHYRAGVMWSKLQRAPFADLDEESKKQYHQLFQALRDRGVELMMVVHHFANPLWYVERGGWENSKNIPAFVDFAMKLVNEFGHYVTSWNTFNEPNLYVSMGWLEREFPPFKGNLLTARTVIQNMAEAHEEVYGYIKKTFPSHPVGISLNCTLFEGENWAGKIPAWFTDKVYMRYPASLFNRVDFFGMSYYARIGFDPLPITQILTPEKISARKKPHDDMWEYYPDGLGQCIRHFWKEFRKPIVITENGICTSDDAQRVKAIRDYLTVIHSCIQEGIDVRGYYHWSTWDNFEWSLGPSFKFGLYSVDPITKDRTRKPSADLFSEIARTRQLQSP